MGQLAVERIETERLILRQFRQTDALSAYKNWAGDKRVQPEYGEPVYDSPEKTSQLISQYLAKSAAQGGMRWAVSLKSGDECIGQVAYFLVDEKNNFAEIEYCIGVPFQGKGYATEATKAVIDFGFDKMKLHKVQICHREINSASRRVIEKCGFVKEGTLRDYFYINGKYQSRVFYSILHHEWKHMKDFESGYRDILGSTVDVEMDRPIGTVHPKHPGLYYPVNYGFVPGLLGGDGEGQDVYLLGVDEKLDFYSGAKVIAVIHRLNDNEDKWVACPQNMEFTPAEIKEKTLFQEEYYDSEIYCISKKS